MVAIVEVGPRGGLQHRRLVDCADTPASIRTLAPTLVGQRNDAAYGGLPGIDAAERDRRQAGGAI